MAFDKRAYNVQYKKEHKDQLKILIPKGGKEQLKKMAESQGKPMTQFIRDALYHYMDDLGVDRINLG